MKDPAVAPTANGIYTARHLLLLLIALLCLSGTISPPIALALGLAFALLLGNPAAATTGKVAKHLLQLSVIGLGFGMNLFAVWEAGKLGVGFTIATISGTMTIGWLLGRALKIEPDTSLLISSGTSICGGSAIAAVGSAIRANAHAMSVSLGTVFLLNAVALFLFPPLGKWLHMNQQQFGLWAAIAIHDTSSVIGAAARYGEEALKMATTVKLARALWIFPITLGLALQRREKNAKISFPWFILLFLAAAGIRTLWPSGSTVYDLIKQAAKAGLTLTLFLIGTGLSREAIATVGFRPLLQGVLLWILVGSAGLCAVCLYV